MSAQVHAFPPSALLHEARQYVVTRRESREGVICPCCEQRAQLYRRKFSAAMARSLIWLYRQGAERRFVHVNNNAPRWVLTFGGYFALMRHWALIEPQPNEDTDKRTSGRWRITPLGVEFVLKRRVIPSHVHLYANRVVGWSDTTMTIGQALGAAFDYAELMGEGDRPVTQRPHLELRP